MNRKLYFVCIHVCLSLSVHAQSEASDVRAVGQHVVGEQERAYVHERERDHTTSARIAVCCSGGGARAMFATAGMLSGLESSGLLNEVSYVSGLSGSTWPLLIWLLMRDYPSAMYTHILNQVTDFQPDRIFHQLSTLIPYLISQSMYYHRPSLIDIYGAFLADAMLHDLTPKMPLKITTHDLQPDPAYHPYIICSSIIPQKGDQHYSWAEITPFEVGGQELQYYTHIHNFGSKFHEGQITSPRPAPTIGYLMGVLGSVMSASVKEIIDMYFKQLHERSLRFLPAKMPNFTRDLPRSPFRDRRKLTFVDAGIDINIPIPPLLAPGRDVDVIIICDASADVTHAPELQRAQQWADKYGKPLPEIDFQRAGKEVCSIFSSDDPHVPTIVYIPRIHNPRYDPEFDPEDHMEWGAYLHTFNMTYTQEQAQQIAGLVEYTVCENTERIKDAIAEKAAINTAK